MEKTRIDLNKIYPGNIFRIVMGVALLLAVAYFIIRQVNFFNTVQLIIFSLAGLYYLLFGFGLNPVSILCKKYIEWDLNHVTLKNKRCKKAINLSWEKVEEVQLNVTNIRFKTTEGSFNVEYSNLGDEKVQQMKHGLVAICKTRNIKLA